MPKEHKGSAADFLPKRINLESLRNAAATCQGCELYRNATQTVFGDGPASAIIVLVGEIPGDQEDKQGHPFVGPAGRLLDNALKEAGIPREKTYITNAVKHFKWEPRGKRRIHKSPRDQEIDACYPWLAEEIRAIKPQVLVCMGATAARAAFGKTVRIKDCRGKFLESRLSPRTLCTIHPSAIYRIPDRGQREPEYRRFVGDLGLVHGYVENRSPRTKHT